MRHDDLRGTKKGSEILANLVRYSMHEGHGVLWQNQGKDRIVYTVKMKTVVVESRMVAFEIFNEASAFNPVGEQPAIEMIDPTNQLFFKADDKKILFKADAGTFFVNNGLVFMPLPKQAFFPELRSNPRLTPNESLAVGLKKFSRGQGHQQYDLLCRNFSRGGFGLTLSYGNAHLFQKSQRLFVCSLGAQELPSPIEGAVAYIRKFHEEKENKILMGIFFNKVLSQRYYESLSPHFS